MMDFDKGSASSLQDYSQQQIPSGQKKKKKLGGNLGGNPALGNITDVMSKKNKASISKHVAQDLNDVELEEAYDYANMTASSQDNRS